MRRSLLSLILVFLLAVSLISCGGAAVLPPLRRIPGYNRGDNNTDERRCHRPKFIPGVDAGTAFVGHSVPPPTNHRTYPRAVPRKFSPSCSAERDLRKGLRPAIHIGKSCTHGGRQ